MIWFDFIINYSLLNERKGREGKGKGYYGIPFYVE